MKNLKKYVALGLIGTMVMGSSLTAFAGIGDEDAEVTGTGTGANMAIDTEVYSVAVPTQDAIDKLFDFDVDPQGLVAASAGARYGSSVKIGDNTGVLFPNYDEALTNITGVSDTSSDLVITNKSSKGIKLAITCKIDKGTATYDGGYSTTPDFSGTGDDGKGLYFGLIQSGDVEKKFDETGITDVNAAKSSADQYEVTATVAAPGAAESYTYGLKTGADKFATYKFAVTAQLNPIMAESTWYTVADHAVTAKTFGTVQLKFTPSLISAKNAYDKAGDAYLDKSSGTLYVGNKGMDPSIADNGFGDTKVASVIVNEKATSITPSSNNVAGCSVVTWSEILTAYGYTTNADDFKIGSDNATELMSKINTVTFTFNGNKYYADVTLF